MSLQAYLAFVAACIALALVPGPVVTLVIANGLRHGTRAALTNILGVQAGLAIVIGIVAIGLTSLMATMGYWFDWVRFAGAAYLVWLGFKLIRSPVEGIRDDAPAAPAARRVLSAGLCGAAVQPEGDDLLRRVHSAVHGHEQGSFLPGRAARRHLHDHRRNHRFDLRDRRRPRAQILFSARRTRLVSRISGGFMIGGGVWLALTRAR